MARDTRDTRITISWIFAFLQDLSITKKPDVGATHQNNGYIWDFRSKDVEYYIVFFKQTSLVRYL